MGSNPYVKGCIACRGIFLLGAILMGFMTSITSAQEYRLVPLGNLGGSADFVFMVNDHRQVVGSSSTDISNNRLAFIWDSVNGMHSLGTLGGTSSVARNINNAGQVCGDAQTASGETHSFFWDDKQGMVDLGTLGGADSFSQDMNELGQIVGVSNTATSERHVFLWSQESGMQDLGITGGIGFNFDANINSLGVVAGYYKPPNQDEIAFFWSPLQGIIYPFGTENSGFLDLNNGNWCAGWKTNPSPGPPLIAVLWKPFNGLVTIGSLNECSSRALVVNDQRLIGGESASTSFGTCENYSQDIFYSPSVLNAAFDAGLQTTTPGYNRLGGAFHINEKNQILIGDLKFLGPPFIKGYLFQDGTTVALEDLLRPEDQDLILWDGLRPGDLNENGDIVGTMYDDNGAGQAFLMRPRPSDVNADGIVNVTDLLLMLGAWGPCEAPPSPCIADTNTDGTINVTDLLDLLADWG